MFKKINIFKDANKAQVFIKIFYIVGILGLTLPFSQSLFFKITPLSILLVGLILFSHHQNWNLKLWLVLAFIGLATFFVEVVGVKTGLLFGEYHYGSSLGIKVYEVPIVIGLNWIVLLYCTHIMVKNFRIYWLLKVILASVLMVIFDFVLEPSAMAMDMWQWNGNTIPLQNYFVWFIVSLFMHIVLSISKLKLQNQLAGFVYLVQMVFFLVLDINFVLIPKLL